MRNQNLICLSVFLILAFSVRGFAASDPYYHTEDPLAGGGEKESGFPKTIESCQKSVVNIQTNKEFRTRVNQPDDLNGKMWRDYFERPDSPERIIQYKSEGSGVVIDNKGLIITNAHVVNGATAIQVVFADKKELPALVVGRNDAEDLALLELADPEVDLSSFSQAVNFGDSEKIQVGEEVFAIGNPLGYKHTVTKGILSAKSREVMDGSRVVMKEMLQTDASINPGNSGCPLFDANGKMVGLVTLKDSRADRIGFAIPVNRIKQILPELKAQNKNDITRLEKFCDRFGFVPGETRNAGGTRRVEILNVNKNAAAEKTGIQSGDVILGFQNQKIGDVNDLLEKASEIKSGERISIIIQRNEKIFFTYMVAK